MNPSIPWDFRSLQRICVLQPGSPHTVESNANAVLWKRFYAIHLNLLTVLMAGMTLCPKVSPEKNGSLDVKSASMRKNVREIMRNPLESLQSVIQQSLNRRQQVLCYTLFIALHVGSVCRGGGGKSRGSRTAWLWQKFHRCCPYFQQLQSALLVVIIP